MKQLTVRIATDEASVVNNRDIPDICLQHMLAVMLIDKTASFRAAHDKARMQDTAVLHERAKIELAPDAEASSAACPSAWRLSRPHWRTGRSSASAWRRCAARPTIP